jgi:4-diphosphocytidyl-2-C-methyl-D-erythritol kinase
VRVAAPAKLNLCLYLGPRRADGLHELCSLFSPLALADELEVAEAERDEVICTDVPAPDLAARALEALRARGWNGPPQRIEVRKRIPVAAGLGGASADAAAVLRLGRGEVEGLEELAAGLGADVPSQLEPSFALVTEAGERVERLPAPEPLGVLLLPLEDGLPTADVYAEADRLGLGRDADELEAIAVRVREAAVAGSSPLDYPDLLVNDLEPAARSLRPDISDALAALNKAGAAVALITGSGPTAFGLFEHPGAASAAADSLRPRFPGVIATTSGATA